jgi:glycerol-3-phosphate acyltransferase PlsY
MGFPRLISLLIGYLFGCVLTGEIIAYRFAGKSAKHLGETGNPGMANIMASLGFVPGILVLVGDIVKTALAILISWLLFKNDGWIVVLYAGLGATLGHDFPFWRGFRGGKGVVTTNLAITVYAPLWGVAANLLGAAIVAATQYLCLAGPACPAVFAVIMFLRGEWEAGVLSLVLTALALYCHGKSIRGMFDGTTSRTDVLGALKKKLFKK